MICQTCNHQTSHIKILPNGKESCHNCGGFAETGGVKTDKILTRNSDRVRAEQQHHEGDMIPPYVFNKGTKQVEVNHDFVELYPNQSAETFSAEELRAAGHGRLLEEVKQQAERDNTAEVTFSGDEQEAIKEVIDGPVSG